MKTIDNIQYFAAADRCFIISISVEHVFSRLQLINERCGDNLFEGMLEIRLSMQCNGDLQALYEATLKLCIYEKNIIIGHHKI